ncbi:MAG: type secretion system protein VirB6 [Rickettsiaceae bacterium]|jgi:type IV secretory pathway VirB6-like protein|nr:type secretion system protein VirB6 [Rickettsiaceae bacterium]
MSNWFTKVNYRVIGVVLAMLLMCQQSPMAFAADYDLPPSLANDDGSKIAYIKHANCDPGAQQQDDINKSKDYEKSCEGQNISLYDGNPFKITVQYDAVTDQDALGAILAAGGWAAAIGGAPAIVGLLAVYTITAAVVSGEKHIPLGGTVVAGFATFEARLEGDKACVYAKMFGATNFRVDRDGALVPKDPKDKTGLNDFANDISLGAMPPHCVYAPPPRATLKPPQWGKFISKVCTDYDSSASNFRYPVVRDKSNPDTVVENGKNRSVTGVIIQCIEETMNNIFTDTSVNNGETFFNKMQKSLLAAIKGLMALYIIFIGYEFIVSKRTFKQEESLWYGLRIALVLYFAAGAGMITLLPHLQGASKDFSLMVMQAASGNASQEAEATSALETAEQEFDTASQNLVLARTIYAKAQKAAANGGSASELSAAEADVDAKRLVYNEKLETLNMAKSAAASFGYNYCDFRDFTYNEAGQQYRMKLWDMIDCKISKYLGVGDVAGAREAPQILLIAVGSLVSHFGLGLFIFAITIILLIFIFLIIIRMVHIYIIASVALVMLVYISPLVIPAALFRFTKGIFDAWLKQVISYTIQPVIMFTFLAFLFSAFDMITYGGNHHFVPMTQEHHANENKLCMLDKNGNRICQLENYDITSGALTCEDKNAPACIYQTVKLVAWKPAILDVTLYDLQFASSIGDLKTSYGNAWIIFVGLLKMLLICFIGHAVLELVEEMARRLTNAAGGGATGLSAAPASSIQTINNATTNKARSFAVAGIKKGVDAAEKSNKKHNAARAGLNTKFGGSGGDKATSGGSSDAKKE